VKFIDSQDSTYHASPDDDVFRHLAMMYSYAHSTMSSGRVCSAADQYFPGGIVNGAQWYAITGMCSLFRFILPDVIYKMSNIKFSTLKTANNH